MVKQEEHGLDGRRFLIKVLYYLISLVALVVLWFYTPWPDRLIYLALLLIWVFLGQNLKHR